ncbi:MAG: N-acetylglucosamine-6-phosphate deacetylase [Candidatus Bipolaricaulota bacterium]
MARRKGQAASLLIRGGMLVDPVAGDLGPRDLAAHEGRISRVWSQLDSGSVIPAEGLFVAPGFFDLQVNGGGGHDLGEADPEAVQAIADSHLAGGTTGLLATVLTAPIIAMRQAMDSVRQAGHPSILGVHLEGPFISPCRAGAHNPEHIIAPGRGRLAELVEGYKDLVRVVTLAPELEGTSELLAGVLAAEAIPALGHSDATYEEALDSVRHGVRSFTHLFNAMRGFHHRDPGPVGAALDTEAYVELICDGVHVHPSAVRLVAWAKGVDRICLVTDSMAAAGLPAGAYTLGGQPVTVRGGEARLADGTLAGSTLTMNRAVKNFMNWTGCSLPEAVRCASFNPARLLGLDERKGSLEVGKDADLVVFDEELAVHYTIIGGEIVFDSGHIGAAQD